MLEHIWRKKIEQRFIKYENYKENIASIKNET